MILDPVYRHQQDTIDIRECMEAISIRLTFERRTPPQHENNEGIYPCGTPKLNTRRFIGRADFQPPPYDLATERTSLNIVVPLVIMSMLVK